jgi:hypothetical protein
LPKQETFFEQRAGNRQVRVIKTYDPSYAREVFRSMDKDALRTLGAALEIDSNYDPADIPDPAGPEYEDFLWDELLQAGIEDVRLDPNLRSFFVVSEDAGGNSEDLYVSADWTSAEGFAKKVLTRQG